VARRSTEGQTPAAIASASPHRVVAYPTWRSSTVARHDLSAKIRANVSCSSGSQNTLSHRAKVLAESVTMPLASVYGTN